MSILGGVEYRCNPACFYCVVNKECEPPYEAIRRIVDFMHENNVHHEDEMTDWGIEFVSKIDERIQNYRHDDPVKQQWLTGEWSHELTRLCREVKPNITDEQLEWLQQFISEI